MENRRAPVLVGVGQLEQRVEDPRGAAEPLEMMIAALERAADDAGKPELLAAADSVRVIRGVWHYGDPARAVAQRVGAAGAQTVGTPYGGNMVQSTLNHAALAIGRGEIDVVLITGAEIGRSQARARKAGLELGYSEAPGEPDLLLGSMEPMIHPLEKARGIVQPIQLYPIFENAIRHARGESLQDHIVRISELWARFNDVAVENPHAWIRTPMTAEQIRTPSATNRMVGFPYPKLMNSNNAVDQAAALILCSLETAERLGIDPDRFVFPHAGSDAHDHYLVSNRADLHSSPAMRVAGRRVLELAEIGQGDLTYVDLYSCFPAAVQIAAEELGLCQQRPLTVTGGLTFGGGPLNNYVMHAIARMVELLREDPGSRGLVTANGGYLTKHAFGVYSSEAPEWEFRHDEPQAQVDALPRREVASEYEGPIVIESYTVMYDGDGPARAHVACLLEDGRRSWANGGDRELAAAMTREEFCGRKARMDRDGNLTVS